MNTQSATVGDVAYGKGVRHCAGRCTRLELFDNAHLDVSPSGVKFSRTQPGQDASLTVVPSGGIVFTLVAGGEAPTGDHD